MPLSLKQSQAIAAIAELIYDFLPGSGNPSWKGHVSFSSIARQVGVGEFYPSGSKTPAIIALLEGTVQYRPHARERLIAEIVRAGSMYRKKNGQPIQKDEIIRLNGLLLDLGFKVPELWDQDFLDRLGIDLGEHAYRVAEATFRVSETVSASLKQAGALEKLKDEFFALHALADRQAAGLSLESILNELFGLFGLEPRKPFRVVGEQIDGSFELDHEIYLLEAKWEQSPLRESDLLVFRGKIEGKSQFTRGLFVALNGISDQARTAITTGKQPNFFVVDGYDLTVVLSGQVALDALLRQKQRILADEGLIAVPYQKLWTGNRSR